MSSTEQTRGTRTTGGVPAASVETALSVRDLGIGVIGGPGIIADVDFDLRPGRVLALVGESGSGKTTAALACMGHLRPGLEVRGGTVTLQEGASRFVPERTELLGLGDRAVRRLRGSTVAYVPQDPAVSLNGAMRVGEQIAEVLRLHEFGDDAAQRRERVAEVLEEVGLPSDRAYQRRYPHQLSGGQQQRIGIAMAFATRPAVIILDEPTTGLDVATQGLVLQTVHQLAAKHGVAGLHITHDLAVVAQVADDIAVMLGGRIVESGSAAQVLRDPRHRYTRRLVDAVPDLPGRKRIGGGSAVAQRGTAAFAQGMVPWEREVERPALEVEALSLSYGEHRVLDGVRLSLRRGETTMLLGESGSGKTTLSRAICGLSTARWEGRVLLDGQPLAERTRQRTDAQRAQLQYIFQSPFSSLNPRRSIGDSLEVPLRMTGGRSARERREAVSEALDRVRLGRAYIDRRPGDLSGGERQRAAIARALVSAPQVLVCDEVTSALDVSVQASVIELLREIQEETGMAMLFVTHNIALARHVAHRVAVLQRGVIVDDGPADQVLTNPSHEYTQELLTHVPEL